VTEILLSVSPSVFSWSMLGRGSSSAAFLLLRPENDVVWPIPRWTHSARIAVVALVVTDLVSISRNAATGRATWRHLSSSPQQGGPREGICPPPRNAPGQSLKVILQIREMCKVWQSSSKEEDHYTFRTIPQEHWSIGMSMARPS